MNAEQKLEMIKSELLQEIVVLKRQISVFNDKITYKTDEESKRLYKKAINDSQIELNAIREILDLF